jgi:hypothetical protein
MVPFQKEIDACGLPLAALITLSLNRQFQLTVPKASAAGQLKERRVEVNLQT